MHVTLVRRRPGQIEFGIIYGGIVLLGLLATRFFHATRFLPACIFKSLTGIPCPTCGSTRAMTFLANGEIAAALYLNPLVSAALIFLLLYLVYAFVALVFQLRRLGVALSGREQNGLRATIGILVALNWFYLVLAAR